MIGKHKNVLLTGARSFPALCLARIFKHAGYSVYLADSLDYYVTSYSSSVDGSFHVPSPRLDGTDAYIDALKKIVMEKEIDLLVPTWEEVIYISIRRDSFPSSCTVFCDDFDKIDSLHNKWRFAQTLKDLGFGGPETVIYKEADDLKKLPHSKYYSIKRCYSRGSQGLQKVKHNKLPKKIKHSDKNPWIAQEWVEGDRFSTYSIAHEGKLKAHLTYPVRFTVDGYSCLTFESIQHLPILEWVRRFCCETNFTGQISFDLIDHPERQILAIECNPRATCGIHLFDASDELHRAFLHGNEKIIYPKDDAKRQIGVGMCFYGWRNIRSFCQLKDFFKNFANYKDIILSRNDLSPFLMQPLVFLSWMRQSRKLGLKLPAFFTHDLDWDGEA
jgi:hypothetical protein